MKNKIRLPYAPVMCRESTPDKVALTIKYLKLLGVPHSMMLNGYNPKYPYLFWDGDHLSITNGNINELNHVTLLEDFISLFEHQHNVQLGWFASITLDEAKEQYAYVYKDEVRVDIKSIPFSKIEEIYKTMLELRKNLA